jgi:hypothetical protein
MTDAPQTEDPMVAALLREREGYVGRGMDDRVAQVDEQLRLRGYEPQSTGKAPTPSRSTPPKGRRARSTEQA